MWIRGAGFWQDRDAHLHWLCNILGVSEVMPIATLHTEPFCLTLAKIAHALAVAKLGAGRFLPFLAEMIRQGDLSSRPKYIGGGCGNEPPSDCLHELELDKTAGVDPNVITVRVRLFGILVTPTYHVVVGRRN